MLYRSLNDMRVDEKEDWLHELCKEYGLYVEYSWGKYYIGFYNKSCLHLDTVIVLQDIKILTLEGIEEIVLEYVLEHGL